MAKTHDDSRQNPQQSYPRRGFMKWAGQLAAGASLVAVALSVDPSKALAEPDCIPCNCRVISCGPNGNCRAQDPNNPILVHYFPFACIQNGQSCPADVFVCAPDCTVCG